MTETITMRVDAMAHGGEAIGRHNGRAIFVPYTIPGELVRVEITEDHDRYARARLLDVVESSPVRVDPPCPFFGQDKCGGCQWQHIDTAVQPRLKGMVTLDQLSRVGRISEPPVFEPIPDPVGWEYRNHALFRVNPEGRLGFLSARSHEVYPITDCLIIHPLLSSLFQSLDMTYPELEWLEMRVGTVTEDLMILLQAKEEESPRLEVDFPVSVVQIRHDDAVAPLVGLDYVIEQIHERDFRISATSFFQVNSVQAAQLVNVAMGALDLQGSEHVVDAYCGVGLFTAFIAPEAASVTGIEVNTPAIMDADHNLADFDNVDLLEGAVEEVLPELDQEFDAILIDPPRTGLAPEVIDAIAAKSLTRVVYVSCDPATLARDALRLTRHGFNLAWVQPVDLFPQTYHIENVALFER